jgi:septal ring factor EnvC (AmiA/AmiB activator)
MRRFLIILPFLLSLPFPAHAASADRQNLERVEQQIAVKNQEQEALAKKITGKQKQLEQSQKDLINLAAEAKKLTAQLEQLDKDIAAAETQKTDMTAKLQKDYGSISQLVLALERMRRIPPEAILLRPGAPLQQAQTAMLLHDALPAVNSRAATLSVELHQLEAVEDKLNRDKQEALAASKSLEDKEAKIAALARTRKKDYESMRAALGQNKQDLQRLSQQASNLRDLMARLDAQQQKETAQEEAMPERRRALASLFHGKMPSPGKAQLPVSGTVTIAFGQRDAIGAAAEGITFESLPGAIITAPMGGVVRFADNFKNYGKLVIIEHKNGYHSLLGGLGRIDASVGQAVKPGEPIGILPRASSRGGKPALYYELRRNGNPVDPALIISGLQS